MKSQNTYIPKPFEYLQGGLLIRFEVERNIKQDEEESDIITFDYREVKVSKIPSEKEIIVAVVQDKYDIFDEISILQKSQDDPEYLEHQERKNLAKLIAKTIVSGYENLDWNDLRNYAATIGVATGSKTKEEILSEIEGRL